VSWRHEHDGGTTAFRSGEVGIGLRLLPTARPIPKLALTREGRERMRTSSATVSSNTTAAMVAAANATMAMARAQEAKLVGQGAEASHDRAMGEMD
jgi:hypothetical protein